MLESYRIDPCLLGTELAFLQAAPRFLVRRDVSFLERIQGFHDFRTQPCGLEGITIYVPQWPVCVCVCVCVFACVPETHPLIYGLLHSLVSRVQQEESWGMETSGEHIV